MQLDEEQLRLLRRLGDEAGSGSNRRPVMMAVVAREMLGHERADAVLHSLYREGLVAFEPSQRGVGYLTMDGARVLGLR